MHWYLLQTKPNAHCTARDHLRRQGFDVFLPLIIKTAKKNKSDSSALVAEKLAKIAKEKKLTKVFFDRGIYKYHGRIKIFAETLRKNGMEF